VLATCANAPQRCTVGSQLDFAGPQAQLIAQGLGDNHPSCLVDG